MATKKTTDAKAKPELKEKRVHINDLAGKELDKQATEKVKGGWVKIICYSSRAMTMAR